MRTKCLNKVTQENAETIHSMQKLYHYHNATYAYLTNILQSPESLPSLNFRTLFCTKLFTLETFSVNSILF